MTEDEWIRILLAIAIGVIFLPRLLKNDKNAKGGKRNAARFSMIFVGFGAIVVFLLWRFGDLIS